MNAESLAAIDIGTNSCRLLIAGPKGEMLYRKSILKGAQETIIADLIKQFGGQEICQD